MVCLCDRHLDVGWERNDVRMIHYEFMDYYVLGTISLLYQNSFNKCIVSSDSIPNTLLWKLELYHYLYLYLCLSTSQLIC